MIYTGLGDYKNSMDMANKYSLLASLKKTQDKYINLEVGGKMKEIEIDSFGQEEECTWTCIERTEDHIILLCDKSYSTSKNSKKDIDRLITKMDDNFRIIFSVQNDSYKI